MKLGNLFAAVLFCFVFTVIEAGAAAKVTVSQVSEGVYSVAVADVAKAAAIDFTIAYDKSTLSNPVITNGPFATAVNAVSVPYNNPENGTLRVAYVIVAKDVFFEGGGLLATVSFAKTGSVPSKLPGLTTDIISIDGVQASVQPIVIDAKSVTIDPVSSESKSILEAQAKAAADAKAVADVKATATSTSTSTSLGTLTYNNTPNTGSPQQQGLKDEQKQTENRDDHQPEPRKQEATVPLGSAAEVAPITITDDNGKKAAPPPSRLRSTQSILSRFSEYKGSRTYKKFVEIIENYSAKNSEITQTPAIVVADGKTIVTVAVDLTNEADTPSFSLKGANLKSIRRVADRKWELDALPQKGKSDVRLSILLKGERIEVSLVAVPPLNQEEEKLTVLSTAALDELLAKPVKNGKPAYDLNSDGRQDYLDDYILIAHWLLKQQKPKSGAGLKPAASGK